MTNTNAGDEAVAEGLYRSINANRIGDYIKEPLEEMMTPLLRGGEVSPLESMDIAQVLIFIHIDLLGYLCSASASASDSVVNAVKFLRQYLGRVDEKYAKVGGLLYHLLRHGWIHRFTPKRLKLNNGTILDFQYSLDTNRERHLKMVEIQGAKKLLISLSLLYNDLLSAIESFAKDIRNNQDMSDVFRRAFEMRREPEEEKRLRVRYNQDLDFIYGLLNQG